MCPLDHNRRPHLGHLCAVGQFEYCVHIQCTVNVKYELNCVNYSFLMHLFYAAKLVPVAFGIKKLQISCVIEDEKVVTTLYSLIDSKFLMVIIFKLSRNQKLT